MLYYFGRSKNGGSKSIVNIRSRLITVSLGMVNNECLKNAIYNSTVLLMVIVKHKKKNELEIAIPSVNNIFFTCIGIIAVFISFH